jgi:hypothetical protein
MSNDPLTTYAAEYNQLFDALPAAVKRASKLLQLFGATSDAYIEADAEVTRILARITELTNVNLRAPESLEPE